MAWLPSARIGLNVCAWVAFEFMGESGGLIIGPYMSGERRKEPAMKGHRPWRLSSVTLVRLFLSRVNPYRPESIWCMCPSLSLAS